MGLVLTTLNVVFSVTYYLEVQIDLCWEKKERDI